MSDAAIRVQCGRCKKRLGVPASAAGKVVRCPNCQAAVRVNTDADADGPVGLAEEDGEPRDILHDLLPTEDETRRNHPRGKGVRSRAGQSKLGRRRRGTRAGATVRLLLSIPFFALAVVSALVTVGAVFISLVQMVEDGAADGKWRAVGYLCLGTMVTMALFYVAECVKHGRFVSSEEAFTKDEP